MDLNKLKILKRFVAKNDNRPVLQTVKVTKKYMIATDSFCVLKVEHDTQLAIEGDLLIDCRTKAQANKGGKIEGKYPDVERFLEFKKSEKSYKLPMHRLGEIKGICVSVGDAATAAAIKLGEKEVRFRNVAASIDELDFEPVYIAKSFLENLIKAFEELSAPWQEIELYPTYQSKESLGSLKFRSDGVSGLIMGIQTDRESEGW